MNMSVKILLFILCVDVIFFLVHIGMANINPDGPNLVNSNFINDVNVGGNGSYVLDSNPELSLPESEGSINPETGNVFTDTFSATKSWLVDTTGLSYLLKITGGPYTYLKTTNLPESFVFSIGALWYMLSIFSLILLITGRL